MLDVKIVGGSIVDGTGVARYKGDIGIRDGRIAALGTVSEEARESLDAGGKIIAPGFIDVHTHYDAQVFWDRMLSVSPWHGVTTVVLGNCGFGIAPTRPADREMIIQSLERVEGMDPESLRQGIGEWPFESFSDYLAAIEKNGCGINVAALIGHLPTRFYVMGEEAVSRAARPEEITRMQEIVRGALRAGAVGFSTSYGNAHFGYKGLPVASRYAAYSETRALVDVLREFPKAVFAPNIGEGMTLGDLAEIAESTRANISWAPLITNEVLFDSNHKDQLARTAEIAERDLTIAAQFSPRPMSFIYQFSAPMLFTGFPAFHEAKNATDSRKLEIFRDAEFRAQFRQDVEAHGAKLERSIARTIVEESGRPRYDGRSLEEIAAERNISLVDAALDIAVETQLNARFRMPLGNHLEENVEPLLHDPNTLISLGDGGAHATQLCDACIPTFVLRRWVREKRSLTLEEAVRMMTSRPADLYNLPDRGRLRLGNPADIVVFDEHTVGDGPLHRVRDLPAGGERLVSEGLGIDAVFVNGTLIRRQGREAIPAEGPMPGQVLRSAWAA